jgi:hypothetical protein
MHTKPCKLNLIKCLLFVFSLRSFALFAFEYGNLIRRFFFCCATTAKRVYRIFADFDGQWTKSPDDNGKIEIGG